LPEGVDVFEPRNGEDKEIIFRIMK